jgi:hypothetical protein
MIVTRIQLFCDRDHGIEIHFPEDGSVDGAIFTEGMLRTEAKKSGWGRAQAGGGYIDLCADCLRDHQGTRLARIHSGRAATLGKAQTASEGREGR